MKELGYYQRRGAQIRTKCASYCEQILKKIEGHYDSGASPTPFICVVGSSGMGKSQLAFALQGTRPYFYWIATPLGEDSQLLYKNFYRVSTEFQKFVRKDLLQDGNMKWKDELTLDSTSQLYGSKKLWTYGFICALLEHCSLDKNQVPRMIRFDTEAKFTVTKCDVNAVGKLLDRMKNEKKMAPFFILDEMIPHYKGMSTAAFQRNVFRACGLVVIVMGTDSKITNLMGQSNGSCKAEHKWMSIVPVFPRYQLSEEREAWKKAVTRFPILGGIAEGSRGRFARYFVDEVVEYVEKHESFELCGLLDEAFGRILYEMQKLKHFMKGVDGKYAQRMAISFSNAEGSPVNESPVDGQGRKRKAESSSMHLTK